jgi:hypothetical protein
MVASKKISDAGPYLVPLNSKVLRRRDVMGLQQVS